MLFMGLFQPCVYKNPSFILKAKMFVRSISLFVSVFCTLKINISIKVVANRLEDEKRSEME